MWYANMCVHVQARGCGDVVVHVGTCVGMLWVGGCVWGLVGMCVCIVVLSLNVTISIDKLFNLGEKRGVKSFN